MSFDPGKVERLYVKEWGHHAVYAADYDQLLALYRDLRHEMNQAMNDSRGSGAAAAYLSAARNGTV